MEKLNPRPVIAKPAIGGKDAVTSDSALATPSVVPEKVGRKLDYVFTPEDIAKEGAHGIDQSNYPWI